MVKVTNSIEQRLIEAEKSYARLLNHLPGLAYRCRVSDNYYYILDFVSKGSQRLLEMSPEEMLKKETNVIENLITPEDLKRTRGEIYDKIVAKEAYSVVYRAKLDNDNIKWIWDQGEGVYDASGKCIFIEGIMIDITDSKLQEIKLKSENLKLRSTIKNAYAFGDMVGKSEAMQTLYETLAKAALKDTNIILYGETGVGKDLAARTIHDLSGVTGRYVPVNCAAIPEQLLESEFFGHIKGAFTGASSNHVGYLAAANNGTLFLDEIAELPLKLQVKLLRAIESRTYTPVGSTEVRQTKFRLISATNQDLQEMVRLKMLRADFYYRIHVLAINIPPLRKRIGDLPLLIDVYAKERGISEQLPCAVYVALEQYAWPGNIRELQNVLDRYWAFGETGIEAFDNISNQNSCPEPQDPEQQNNINSQQATQTNNTQLPLFKAKEEIESVHILNMLKQCHWHKGETAIKLGVTLRTLQRKIKKYNIIRL